MKITAILFSVLIMTGTLFAQGMGQRRQFYDPSKVTTITGTIAAVDSQETPRGGFYMVQLTVQDSSGTTPVMVAPSSYLDSQNITFNKGNSIQVTGAKMNFRGNDVFIAGQIVIGGKTIKLRDDSGRPVWRGQMR
jgi:DNA polymerase III alpha subunit